MKSSHILAVALAIGATVWVLSGQFGDEAPASTSTDAAVTDSDQPEREATQVRVRQSVSEPYVLELTVTGRTEANRAVSLRVQTSGRISEILVEEGQIRRRRPGRSRASPPTTGPNGWRVPRRLCSSIRSPLTPLRSLPRAAGAPRPRMPRPWPNSAMPTQSWPPSGLISRARTIKAPFTGVLNSLNIELGDVVTEGFGEADQVGQIFDLDPVIVIASVSEREIGRISVGDVGRARLVTGEVVEGVVRFVGQVAEPETRTFPVELEGANETYAIPSGLTADVILPLDTITSHYISPSAVVPGR